MSEIGSEKLDNQEIFDDIINLINSYSTKSYSKREIQIIKELLRDE